MVTEEVQRFHLNPEKVELEETQRTKARDGVHAKHRRDSVALRTWPPASSNSSASPTRAPGSRVRVEAQRGRIGGEKGGRGGIGRAGEGTGAWGGASGRRLCAVRPGCRLGFLRDCSKAVHPKPARARAEDRRGAKAGVAETRPLGRPCPRGLPPSTPHRAFPESPLQTPRPLTVIVVAHFLLAASLTVRHGLRPPPPGCGSSSGCSRPPRPGGQTRGLRGTAGAAALGARAARSGTAAGAWRAGGRRARLAAAPTRDTRQG